MPSCYRTLIFLGALLSIPAAAPAHAEDRCGSRNVQITGWGSNWVQINLDTLLTLTDASGENASRNSSFINAKIDSDLDYFTINIGYERVTLHGGEERTIRIPGPVNSYNTIVTWCRKQH